VHGARDSAPLVGRRPLSALSRAAGKAQRELRRASAVGSAASCFPAPRPRASALPSRLQQAAGGPWVDTRRFRLQAKEKSWAVHPSARHVISRSRARLLHQHLYGTSLPLRCTLAARPLPTRGRSGPAERAFSLAPWTRTVAVQLRSSTAVGRTRSLVLTDPTSTTFSIAIAEVFFRFTPRMVVDPFLKGTVVAKVRLHLLYYYLFLQNI